MTVEYCTDCNGYGFDVFNRDNRGALEIQRCDTCTEVDDDVMTILVSDLAKAALDAADVLIWHFDREDESHDMARFFAIVDLFRLQVWPEGRSIE